MEQAKRVLVVDDEEMNRRFLVTYLTRLGYEVHEASDGIEGLAQAQATKPDLILLDIKMPRMNGLELTRKLKDNEETKVIPIVIVSSFSEVDDRVKALEAGADDFLAKPPDRTELRARVRSLLRMKDYNDHMRDYQKILEAEVHKRTEQLRGAFEEIKTASEKLKKASLDTIFRLSQAAEYKDEDTGNHIKRIGYITAVIAEHFRMAPAEIESMLYAAPMHDVGKIGIPDRYLMKPGKLDAEEWEIMKQHTIIGSNLLKGSESHLLAMAENIALTHHEKWDGSGYPRGLRGTDIPLAGRITAIADVFDALTSKRPYKEAFPIDRAFGILREGREKHFDPEVVDAFFAMQERVLEIREGWPE